jgi:DNA-binding transcriptional regulator YhcF (GntR family)
LEQARESYLNLGKRYEAQKHLSAGSMTYYSAWYYAAIHLQISIPGFETVPRIAQKLKLEPELVGRALEELEQMRLVEREGDTGRWSVKERILHLPKENPFSAVNHAHWSQVSSERAYRRNPRDIHYASLYTLSQEDYEKLRRLVFDFIESARTVVEPSKEEQLCAMVCDLFVI